MTQYELFDAHFHIIDPRFPLVPNRGYIPGRYTVNDYRDRLEAYSLAGGAVVSGSFQVFDQDWLVNALSHLGPGFVGVTQLPVTVRDEEIQELDQAGIRAVRFNLKRGGSETIEHLDRMARRVNELAGWHVELYADAKDLTELFATLVALPAVSIDHLGLSKEGFPTLLALAEKGVRVKASGFGRVDFDVRTAIRELYATNPDCLMFGTDLPSTRAARAYADHDFQLITEVLGQKASRQVLYTNAVEFYRISPGS